MNTFYICDNSLMPRVRVIHWKPQEAGPLLDDLRASGHQVEFDESADAMTIGRAIKASPPDAILIDTSRLPGHARQFARWMGETAKTRTIPVLLVPPELRGGKLKRALLETMRTWKPPERSEFVSSKTVAQKLGLKDGEEAGVVNEPADCAALRTFPYRTGGVQPVMLWFVETEDELFGGLPEMQKVVARTKLWLAWRKGGKTPLNGNALREAAIGAGLVDYKICSLDERWSAMAFALRKAK